MSQLTEDDLKGMTPHEISRARQDGRLAQLLGADPADVEVLDRAGGTLNRADVVHLNSIGRHDLVAAASHEDRIDYTDPKDNS